MPVAVVIAVAGLFVVHRNLRSGRDLAPAMLAAMPLAVLLLVAPIPFQSWRSITSFQAVAESGDGGMSVASSPP